MINANALLCEVNAATIDREMALQAVLGPEIFKRYGITGNIEQVNENHRLSVQAFNTKWGGQA